MSSFRRHGLALVDIVPVDNRWRYSERSAYALDTMKLKALTFIIQFRRELAATFAALAVLSAVNVVKPTSPATILAAASNLPAGHVLTQNDVKPIPVSSRWPSAISESEQVTGQALSHSLEAGTPINRSDLLTNALSATFDAQHKAVSIDISQTDSTIATIGSHVDVFSASGEQISAHSLVLATSQASHSALSLGSSQTVAVVLSMTFPEISQLARAKSNGALTVAATAN